MSQSARDRLEIRGVRVMCRYDRPATVPAQLLRSSNISSHGKCAFALLDVYSHHGIEKSVLPQEQMAKDMGVSVPTVRRALSDLIGAGYLRMDPIVNSFGRRTGTTYTLTDVPHDWEDEAYSQEYSSSVYFIQRGEGGPIKIGVSTDVATRLRSLQAKSSELLVLLGTLPGGAELEQALHGRFRDQKVEGEWFRLSPELLRLACGAPRP